MSLCNIPKSNLSHCVCMCVRVSVHVCMYLCLFHLHDPNSVSLYVSPLPSVCWFGEDAGHWVMIIMIITPRHYNIHVFNFQRRVPKDRGRSIRHTVLHCLINLFQNTPTEWWEYIHLPNNGTHKPQHNMLSCKRLWQNDNW